MAFMDTLRQLWQEHPVAVIGVGGGGALLLLSLFSKKGSGNPAPGMDSGTITYQIYGSGNGTGYMVPPGGSGSQKPNLGGPTSTNQSPALCPPGLEWDTALARCVRRNLEPLPKPPSQGCPDGYEWNSTWGRCVPVQHGRHPYGGGGGTEEPSLMSGIAESMRLY